MLFIKKEELMIRIKDEESMRYLVRYKSLRENFISDRFQKLVKVLDPLKGQKSNFVIAR